MMRKYTAVFMMLPVLWAVEPAVSSKAPPVETPRAQETPAWKVYDQPSLESPSHEIHPKDWKIESGDWYRLTDQDQGKTYWVHRDTLKDHQVYINTMMARSSHSSEDARRSWERFDQQFEEMMAIQDRYMKEMRVKASQFFRASYTGSRTSIVARPTSKKISQFRVLRLRRVTHSA